MDNGASSYHRFLEGDKSGFEEILDMFGNNLIFFINGFVKNLAVAEDLMEDTFLELIIHKKHFKENATFKTYLFTIARNKSLNYIKKHNRYQQSPLDDMQLPAQDDYSIEECILKEERQKQVHNALHSMKQEYNEVIHLLYFEDMSYESAAVVLKKSKKQIDNLIYNAKQQLKSTLIKEGFSYEE